MSSQASTIIFAQQPPRELLISKSHLTPEELLILIKEEENLPQAVDLSLLWEYNRNELEFE